MGRQAADCNRRPGTHCYQLPADDGFEHVQKHSWHATHEHIRKQTKAVKKEDACTCSGFVPLQKGIICVLGLDCIACANMFRVACYCLRP